MNWEALGALAELVGALAVVVTLVYFAAQIRQNTSSVRSASIQAASQNFRHTAELIGQSPENADVFRRGLAAVDTLPASEQMHFTVITLAVYHNADDEFWFHRNGLLSDEMAERQWGYLGFYLRSPGGRSVWETAKAMNTLTKQFVAEAESRLLPRSPAA